MATIGQSAKDLWNQVAKPLNDTAGQINQAVGGAVGSAMGKAPPVQGATSLPPPVTPKIAPSVNVMPNFQGVKTPATTQKPIDSSWIGDGLQQNTPQAPATPEIQSGASSDVMPQPKPTETAQIGTEATPTDTSIPPTPQSMDDLYRQRQQIAGQETQTAQLALKQQQEQEKLAREARDVGFAQTQLNQQRDQAEKDAQASWQIKNSQAKDNLEKFARQLDQTVNRQGMNSLAISDARKAMETQNLIYQKMVSDNTQDTKNMMRSFEKAQADIDQRMIDTVGAINKDAYAQVIAGLTVDDSPASIQKLSELMQKANAIKTQELAKYAMAKEAVTQQYAQQYEAFKQEQAQVQAMNKPDDKLSKLSGVMMNASGQPILGENGQPIPIPKELEKTISDDEGNVYAIYKDGTSAPIMGAKEKATAQNLQPIDVGGKVMLYNPRTGTMQEIDKTMSQQDIAKLQMEKMKMNQDQAQFQASYGLDSAKFAYEKTKGSGDFTSQKIGVDSSGKDIYGIVDKNTGKINPIGSGNGSGNIESINNKGLYGDAKIDSNGMLQLDLNNLPQGPAGSIQTQCAYFVNRVLGLPADKKIPSAFSGKKALMNEKNIYNPSVGSVFIASAPGRDAKYGHTGIVTGVKYTPSGDLQGIYITDRNADGRGTVRENVFIDTKSPAFSRMQGYINYGQKKEAKIDPTHLAEAQSIKSGESSISNYDKDERSAIMDAKTELDRQEKAMYKEYPDFSKTLNSIQGNAKERQALQSQVTESLKSGDAENARRAILAYAQNKVPGKGDFSKQIQTTDALEHLVTSLEQYKAQGGDTGPLEKFMQKLNKGTSQEFETASGQAKSDIEREIVAALQPYRSAVTGAAWGEQESAEYEKMFPGIGTDIDAMIRGYKSIAGISKRKTDASLSQVFGDAEGVRNLMKAGKVSTQGKEDKVSEYVGYAEDAVKEGATNLIGSLKNKGKEAIVNHYTKKENAEDFLNQ